MPGDGPAGGGDETADRHDVATGATVGYVERNAGGWTELRVHGVAGTAPESVLEHPHAAQVAGNEDAGFLRRLWEARSVSADTPRRRREAYSWGGLTSGDNTRALWLLLLPFMLLNVAFYMTPYRRPPGSTDRTDRRRDRAAAAVQRVLALSFTATFTLTTIGVAMDLVGWQCAAGRPQGADVCGTSWLSWLTWAWLDQPGRQVAVTALVPLAVAGLLWGLAGSTWNRMESVEITQERPGYATEICTPLEDRAMWNGRATVRRLRAVHVATAVTLPGVFALATLGWRAAWPLLVPQLVLLAVMLLLVIAPGAWSRRTPAADSAADPEQKRRQRAGERRDPYHWMPRIALVLTGAALVAVCVVDTVEPAGTLPWLVTTVQGLFVAQALALLVLLVICVRLAARAAEVRAGGPPRVLPTRRTGRSTSGRRGAGWRCRPSRCWRGCSPAGSRPGWCCGPRRPSARPVARGQRRGEPYPLVVPTAYQWVAVAALALGVVAVLVGVVAWWRLTPVGGDGADRGAGLRCRRAGEPGAPRRDRAGVGPGDGAARGGRASAGGPAGAHRGRRWWRASWASCPSGPRLLSEESPSSRWPASRSPGSSSGCWRWAGRPTATPRPVDPSGSSGTSARSGRGRSIRSPRRATPSARSPT